MCHCNRAANALIGMIMNQCIQHKNSKVLWGACLTHCTLLSGTHRIQMYYAQCMKLGLKYKKDFLDTLRGGGPHAQKPHPHPGMALEMSSTEFQHYASTSTT